MPLHSSRTSPQANLEHFRAPRGTVPDNLLDFSRSSNFLFIGMPLILLGWIGTVVSSVQIPKNDTHVRPLFSLEWLPCFIVVGSIGIVLMGCYRPRIETKEKLQTIPVFRNIHGLAWPLHAARGWMHGKFMLVVLTYFVFGIALCTLGGETLYSAFTTKPLLLNLFLASVLSQFGLASVLGAVIAIMAGPVDGRCKHNELSPAIPTFEKHAIDPTVPKLEPNLQLEQNRLLRSRWKATKNIAEKTLGISILPFGLSQLFPVIHNQLLVLGGLGIGTAFLLMWYSIKKVKGINPILMLELLDPKSLRNADRKRLDSQTDGFLLMGYEFLCFANYDYLTSSIVSILIHTDCRSIVVARAGDYDSLTCLAVGSEGTLISLTQAQMELTIDGPSIGIPCIGWISKKLSAFAMSKRLKSVQENLAKEGIELLVIEADKIVHLLRYEAAVADVLAYRKGYRSIPPTRMIPPASDLITVRDGIAYFEWRESSTEQRYQESLI